MNFILSKAKQLLAALKVEENDIKTSTECDTLTLPQKDKNRDIIELRKNNIWTEKECALLIAALEDVYFEKKDRANVISALSAQLRSMGKERGIDVNELYRNESGITLQMLKMEYLLTDGNKGLSGASKTFEKVADIYKNDISLFNQKFSLNAKGLSVSTNTTTVKNASKKEVVVVHIKRRNSAPINNAVIKELNNNDIFNKEVLGMSVQPSVKSDEEKWKSIDDIIADYITASETEPKSEIETQPKQLDTPLVLIEKEYSTELKEILSTLINDLDDFYNKFYDGSKKQNILSNRMMSSSPEALILIARRYNITENEVENIEKSLYTRIKTLLIGYNEKIRRLFEQYKQPLEFDASLASRLKKYYVLLNNLSSYTECFIDISSNKLVKVKKIESFTLTSEGYTTKNNSAEINKKSDEKTNIQKLSISGTKAIAFDIDNYFEEVKGWSNLYVAVFNYMIKKYKQQKKYPVSIVAAYTKGTKKGRYVRLNNGLWLNVNYSAEATLQRITELLDCYGFSSNECTVYIENNLRQTAKIKISDALTPIYFDDIEQEETSQASDTDDKYSDLIKKVRIVLQDKYRRGFRLDSHLEKERFKLFFEQINSEKIPEDISEDVLKKLISKCGIIFEDRVYLPENLIDEETKNNLFEFINKSFEEGHNTIYYTALFEQFSNDFLTQSIFNADILREYIKHQNAGKFYVFKDYLSKDKSINQSITDEIIQSLVDRSEPFYQNELISMLPHIDKHKLIKELRSSPEFVSNGKEQYFLIKNFNITNDEKETVKKLITDLLNISCTHFVTAAEVMELIHKKLPEIFDNNGFISELGIRNALSFILGDTFSFNSNVISKKGSNLNLNNVFEDFAKNNSKFSLAELKNLASEFSSPIYFDAIRKYSIRINKDEFIEKQQHNFCSKEVDYAISLFCQADYVSIQDVDTFASFPDVGYKWNIFLLESYLQNYSNEFKLLQASACETKSVGAIVKRTSSYTNLDDVLIDVLARSRCQLQKDDVLQFLCDHGYIARRIYSSIENIIEKAVLKRNAKG